MRMRMRIHFTSHAISQDKFQRCCTVDTHLSSVGDQQTLDILIDHVSPALQRLLHRQLLQQKTGSGQTELLQAHQLELSDSTG